MAAPALLIALAIVAPSVMALSVTPPAQRSAALEHARLALLRVGEPSGAAFGAQNAPVTLIEASATADGAILKTLPLPGVTAFAASATGGGGATLSPNAESTSISFVGLTAPPRAESARALGPVDGVVVSVDFETGAAKRLLVARGSITAASGAPLTAAPGPEGGSYMSFANAGGPLSWFPGESGEHTDPIAFGLADCSFLAPRVLDGPSQLVFWASGRGCGGGVGLMATNKPQPQSATAYALHAGAFKGPYADASSSSDTKPLGWTVVMSAQSVGAPQSKLKKQKGGKSSDGFRTNSAALTVYVSDASVKYGGLWRFAFDGGAFTSGAKPWCKPQGGIASLTTVGDALVWLDTAGTRVWKASASDDACEPKELLALSLANTNASYTSVSFVLPSGKWPTDAEKATADALLDAFIEDDTEL